MGDIVKLVSAAEIVAILLQLAKVHGEDIIKQEFDGFMVKCGAQYGNTN